MKKTICKHCLGEIGEWTDPWGGHWKWMHAPDDGPDAYQECRGDGWEAEPFDPYVCFGDAKSHLANKAMDEGDEIAWKLLDDFMDDCMGDSMEEALGQ
jgi:hypothetical protein